MQWPIKQSLLGIGIRSFYSYRKIAKFMCPNKGGVR